MDTYDQALISFKIKSFSGYHPSQLKRLPFFGKTVSELQNRRFIEFDKKGYISIKMQQYYKVLIFNCTQLIEKLCLLIKNFYKINKNLFHKLGEINSFTKQFVHCVELLVNNLAFLGTTEINNHDLILLREYLFDDMYTNENVVLNREFHNRKRVRISEGLRTQLENQYGFSINGDKGSLDLFSLVLTIYRTRMKPGKV
ncbi:hypothetical protein Cantr_03095 [Candida viswanathii]|uniref:Uncharacterized protein n=1 Tax=Candida viswanathii TaxID=5486 RepID=A0A367YNB5_9ASCO|nr:hypothetical protein Cantr_03095 [Candida viswanathii]